MNSIKYEITETKIINLSSKDRLSITKKTLEDLLTNWSKRNIIITEFRILKSLM